jgi:sugar phosphate isomerase/epimerase
MRSSESTLGAKMALDVGMVISEEARKGFRTLSQDSQRISIKSMPATIQAGRDEHLPIGAGTIDFTRIVRALKDIRYHGTITLEVLARDGDYPSLSRGETCKDVREGVRGS